MSACKLTAEQHGRHTPQLSAPRSGSQTRAATSSSRQSGTGSSSKQQVKSGSRDVSLSME